MKNKKNCTTCTRLHDSAECLECQAAATDDNQAPMWLGEEDAFYAAVERLREMIDIVPSTINHRLHEMLDELAKIYNGRKTRQITFDEAVKAIDTGLRVRQYYDNGEKWIEYFTLGEKIMVKGSHNGTPWENANHPRTIIPGDGDTYELR